MLGLGMMVLLSRRSYDRDAGIVRRWYFLLLMMVVVVVDMLGGGSKMIRGVSAHIHGPANVTLISMFPSSPWRSKLKKKRTCLINHIVQERIGVEQHGRLWFLFDHDDDINV